MADEFRTDGDLIVPGDECMACGERAEAHIKFNDVGEIEREPSWCTGYRRSPLSAFRGPAVTFTREEAAGWVAVLLDLWASRHVLGLPEQIRAAVRMYVRQARWSIDVGLPRDAARLYLAARILRAVRP